ncbi:MAG: radical SAM protein, partial [Acidobacteriaceae bacterium]|nr:radical SAM protein [Acidobacteriaceae bacterium]
MNPGEYHAFEAAGRQFLYLVPSAAVFELDDASSAVLEQLPADGPEIERRLSSRFSRQQLAESIGELTWVKAIRTETPIPAARQQPPVDFPLTTMVLNVTNQCNLSCTYCYEYGEDKIVDTENGPQSKFMSESTARESVDFMFRQAGANRLVHCTFFGGETLLNFPVLKSAVAYARRRAAELGKEVDFSLTTNATLLRQDVIEWLVENRVGVTISIDGPKEMQDQFRVFKSGVGSYDIVAPKIKELLRQHTSRPIGARVTLTSQTLDIGKIYRHLTEEIGFWEVGFAPVTTSPERQYSISNQGFDA